MTRAYRTRDVRFRVVCDGDNKALQERVEQVLLARGILPETCIRRLSEVRVEVDVHIRDAFGVQAIHLARICEKMPGVLGLDLEIDGKPVDFHVGRTIT